MQALHDEVLKVRASMGTKKNLGNAKAFQDIRTKALKLGWWVCSCMVCEDPVKDLTEFGDLRFGKCKDCANINQRHRRNGTTSATQTARQQQTMGSNERVGSNETKECNGTKEDEVMQNFLVPVLSQNFEVEVMPEFRRADAVIKCPNGKYIPIQLKTASAFREDGSPRPDNSTQKDGGRATFGRPTSGYEMPVILIKSRVVGEIIKWYIWVEHGSKITTSGLKEHTDGTLGPQKIPKVDVQGLIDAIREMRKQEEYHVSFIDAWFDVQHKEHFKEVANIQALRAVRDVDVPRQSQQAFDCFFDKRRIQVKPHTVKSGDANLNHRKNGHVGQPYDSEDPIDAFCFVVIIRFPVQTGDGIVYCYFMLYCEIPMDVLIKNKVVKHGNEGGITTLCLHPGIYEEMLIGRTKITKQKTAWLDAYPFKHVRLYEHTPEHPQVHQLTKENLEKVAQTISKPDAVPQCMFD